MMPSLNIGCYPFVLRFCDNQKQWNREIKRYSRDPDSWKRRWCNQGASATAWRCVDDKNTVSFIVSFDRAVLKGKSASRQAGTAAHESVHIVDWIFERVGEENNLRGTEVHAYQVQELTEWMLRHLWAVKKRK